MEKYKKSLEIELTSKCILACPGCARTIDKAYTKEWHAGDMPLDYVKKLCDSTDYIQYNFIGCYGDAIYHPKFIEICEYFLEKNKKILVHTNGSNKPAKWWERLAQLNWNKNDHTFTFSLDGLEDTNHIYRINAKWNTILQGIQILTKAKNQPALIWKFIKFPYNAHQINQAKLMSKDLGFDTFEIVDSYRSKENYKTKEEDLNLYVSKE